MERRLINTKEYVAFNEVNKNAYSLTTAKCAINAMGDYNLQRVENEFINTFKTSQREAVILKNHYIYG